jgi:PAS domain S-box-containing protein
LGASLVRSRLGVYAERSGEDVTPTFATDELPDPLLVIRDGRVAYANRRACAVLGCTSTELVGSALETVFAEGETERLHELQRQQEAGWAPPETFRLRLLRRAPAGQVLADVRFSGSGDELLVSARDITETSRGEGLVARLAEIAARVSGSGTVDAFLDACEPVFVELRWTVAYSAVGEGATTTPLRILGAADDPIVIYGRSIVGIPLEPARAPIAAEVVRLGRAIFLDNLPTTQESSVREAVVLDGNMRQAHVRRSAWCPVWRAGKMSALLSVAGSDLTEHDFVAVQLLAAQIGATEHAAELQVELVRRERLAAMGELSAVLAHEVRNPLAVIFNALATLKHEGVASTRAKDCVRILDEEAVRLRSVVSEVLDFVHPEAVQLVSVDLHEVVEDVVSAAVQDYACPPPDDTRIMIDVPSDLPSVLADRALLRRALLNLVGNAFCHVPVGGSVRVTGRVEDGDVRLSIFNDGVPIAGDAAPRVFEPFFTTRPQGTGLGLFVVHRTVQLLGGRVELDPTSAGVQFSVVLRRADPGARLAH